MSAKSDRAPRCKCCGCVEWEAKGKAILDKIKEFHLTHPKREKLAASWLADALRNQDIPEDPPAPEWR